MLFINNGRVMGNLILSGLLDRYTKVKFVSVESGIGWMPFLLEAIDYEYQEVGANKRKLEAQARASISRRTSTPASGSSGAICRIRSSGRRRQRAVRDRLPAPGLPVSDR